VLKNVQLFGGHSVEGGGLMPEMMLAPIEQAINSLGMIPTVVVTLN